MKFRARHELLWRRLFQIGVAFKAIDGLLETAGGLLFLLVTSQTMIHVIFALTRNELLEDPDDWIATHLRGAFVHLSTQNKIFAAAYLLGHGLVKLGLVAGLWRDKLWSFPAALVILAAFVGYQVYRLVEQFSLVLCFLSVVDLGIIALVWIEYQRVKHGKNLVR